MNSLGTTPADVFGTYPVVLTIIKDVAHLVCSDGVHVFIIAANFFPLEGREQQQTKKTINAVTDEHKTTDSMTGEEPLSKPTCATHF